MNPLRENLIRFRYLRAAVAALAALCLLLGAGTARGQAEQESARITDISTIGTNEGQFLAVVALVEKSDGSFLPRTDIRFRPVGAGADEWTKYSAFDARVSALAQRRGDLAVLLELSGGPAPQTQLRFIYNPLEVGSQPIDIPGPALPSGLVLFDIAGGRGDHPMLAAGQREGKIEVLSLRGETWSTLPALPDDLRELGAEAVDLADARGRPIVAARLDAETVAVLLLRDDQWLRRDVTGLSEEDRFVLVDGTAGDVALLYVFGQSDRIIDPHLTAPDAEPMVTTIDWRLAEGLEVSLDARDPQAASIAVGAVRLVRAALEGERRDDPGDRGDGGDEGDEVLIELALDARTLEPTGKGEAVPLRLATMSAEQVRQQIVMLVLYGLLIVAVVTVLRQKPMPTPERLKDVATHLAPLSLRLAAGVVDALPLLIILGVWYKYDERLEVTAEWVMFGVGGVVYFGHLILAEWLTGRSLGKAMFSLKVVRTDGAAAGLWAIVLRNILRPLDVATFGVTLVMAVLTPLRQRLGDMAAATTVVQTRRKE